jgi:hypothetical protein
MASTILMEAPGYLLYLPPMPIKSRFVMLEETTNTFYDVDTQTPLLGNPASRVTTGLSPSLLGSRPAIVFLNPLGESRKKVLRDEGFNPEFVIGKPVSIESQEGKNVFAKVVGRVNVKPLPQSLMSWEVLKTMKGAALPDEMENGLLGKLWGGEDRSAVGGTDFVTPRPVLDNMPRKWHVDPAALNTELDGIFTAGKKIQEGELA